MPKIPMSNKAGAVQYQRSTVPLTNVPRIAPVVNHDAEALVNFGKEISNAGGRIFDAASGLVSARNKFFQQLQDTEDRLAATEARNLYRTINADLKDRMSKNPAQFDKFEEWAQEADKRYADEVKSFTGKMSADFRKQFEAEMSGIRIENLGQRTELANHARVTANYNLFQSQWKDAALRGDLAECNRLLESERGKLINEQEYQQKKLDYARLADFGLVKRAVEGNVPGIIEKLKERNPEGGYVNFSGLEESARDRFIRVAESQDAVRRANENAILVDRLNSGEQITLEQIEKNFEGQTSPEALRQKLIQKEIVRKVLHTRAGYKAKATEEQRKRKLNAAEWDIYSYNFSSDPTVNKMEYAKLQDKINSEYAPYDEERKILHKQLDAVYLKKTQTEKSYKNTPIYKDGEKLIAIFKDQGRFFADKNWSFRDDESKATVNLIEKAIRLDLDHYIQDHPKATQEEVYKYLDSQINSYNKNTAEKIGAIMLNSIRIRGGRQAIQERGNVIRTVKNGENGGKR